MAKSRRFVDLAESVSRGDSLTSPQIFICIWSFITLNYTGLDSLKS
jgi:hypothetical protein